MDSDITYVFIDPRGIEKMGVGSGVSRDVYCTFWREVSDSYLIGDKERVPFVRHDLYKPEWQAIGKILVKGYIDTGYFQTTVSKSFLHYCLFGEVPSDELIASFLNYIAADERIVIDKVMSSDATEDDFSSDELFLLDQFKCRSKINKDNAREVVTEIARQEIIQKPHLMSSCSQIYSNI